MLICGCHRNTASVAGIFVIIYYGGFKITISLGILSAVDSYAGALWTCLSLLAYGDELSCKNCWFQVQVATQSTQLPRQNTIAQLSHPVVSNSLQPHGLQHARLPCPSQTPRACSNPCLSQWCHPTISSSVIPFSSCPQSFPASASFQMSQLFASGGQRIGVSVSTSVLPMNTQEWSPLGWTAWISSQSKGLSRVFSNTTVQSINSLVLSFL